MRQVPQYFVIGNGRVAKHFRHYFSLLNLPVSTWQRGDSLEKLQNNAALASHILVLISDQAIENFIQQHLSLDPKTKPLLIHFSGSLVTEYAYGAHPLMSFSHQLYQLDDYQSIPFILDHDAPDFADLLPGLPNPHVRLSKLLKAKYHALCVLGGNFSCILWQKLFSSFEKELNLPAHIAHPYLLQQTKNLFSDAKSALTGPLVRNDKNTIEKNIQALDADPFQDIYKSFVMCYQKLIKEEVV